MGIELTKYYKDRHNEWRDVPLFTSDNIFDYDLSKNIIAFIIEKYGFGEPEIEEVGEGDHVFMYTVESGNEKFVLTVFEPYE